MAFNGREIKCLSKVQGCPGVEPELRGSMDAELGESDPHFRAVFLRTFLDLE